MAVGSASGAARTDGSQKLHFIRKRFQFSDANLTAGVVIGRIPARSYLTAVSWYKSAAFNSGTSDNATIGTGNATDAGILASTAISGTGFVNHTAAAGLGLAVTAEADVYLRWVASGAAATAGDVTVVISYSPDNDN